MSLISISFSIEAMFIAKAATYTRSNAASKWVVLPSRAIFTRVTDCGKPPFSLIQVVEEKNYKAMLTALPKYAEAPECYRSGNCCLLKKLNTLHDELQEALIVVQAAKLHQQKIQKEQKIKEELIERDRNRFFYSHDDVF